MVMTDVTSVAANTTSGNLLAGKNKEFLDEASILQIGAVAAAVGVFCTVVVGTEVIVDDQQLGVGTTLPIFPDQILAEGGGFAGDRVTLRMRNSTGAAIICYTKINISPV